jgi:hypothetical protein
MSYKTDSEVYEGAYGFVKQRPNLTAQDLQIAKKDVYMLHFKKRQNAVLWFVSNCVSKYRIQVALDISQYYPVHIFGKCDPLDGMDKAERKRKYPFLRVFSMSKQVECGPGSECEAKKLASFKYYLAFENKVSLF